MLVDVHMSDASQHLDLNQNGGTQAWFSNYAPFHSITRAPILN
jgi:hypothetical protein